MLEQGFYILILGFIGHRLGIMLFDFLSYGEIFGNVKLWIAKKVDPEVVWTFIENNRDLPKSEAQNNSFLLYDILSNYKGFYAFLIALTDCKFCTTVWTSLFTAIVGIVSFDIHVLALILVPIFGYFFTEKI